MLALLFFSTIFGFSLYAIFITLKEKKFVEFLFFLSLSCVSLSAVISIIKNT